MLFAICLGLVLATAVAYWSVTTNDWINYDDTVYLTENEVVKNGFTTEGIAWAFTSDKGGNWHPLTWLTIMLDVELWGMNVGGHHASNVVLHAASTVLLFLVLVCMTRATWQSAFVAGAFALHPLHVESVAWIAERKDTLSALFWMLTLGSYWWYVQRPAVGRYLAVVTFLALGLMSKPMVVTLPFVLLLLDFWPLQRLQAPAAVSSRKKKDPERAGDETRRAVLRLLREKIPLFALVAIVSVVTVITQGHSGAVMSVDAIPVGLRIENALVAYMAYLGQMIWPVDLTVFYPYQKSLPAAKVIVAFLALAGASGLGVYLARRRPYLVVGWLWYVGTLVPVIGLVQVGKQPMADRYTYIPLIGAFIIVAWGVADLVTVRGRRIVLAAAGGGVLAAWLVVTQMQVRHWQNSVTLYEHTLRVTEDNYMIHYNLGLALQDQKRNEEATAHYVEAIRIAPRFGLPHNNLAMLLGEGKTKEAIEHYEIAARFNKSDPEIHNNLANALSAEGRDDEADVHFRESLRLKPSANTYSNYALHLIRVGRYEEAARNAHTAIRMQPRFAQAHNNLGTALAKQGKASEAIAEYREALRLMPGWPPAERRLAWVLSTYPDAQVRNAAEALSLARHATQRTGNRDPDMLDTLAAAAAEAGAFGEALETAERAAALAEAAGKTTLTAEIRQRAELYRAGQPYREMAAAGTPAAGR